MRQDGSIALFQYWNRLRGRRPAPKRSEIEPADIRALLADTFILERNDGNEPIFRLAGTRLCATYGRELKSVALTSLWGERDQRGIARLVGNVFEANSVVVVTFNGVSRDGRSNPFELTILPLDGGRGAPRALGAILPCAKPFWLGADPVLLNVTDTLRVIDTDIEPAFLENRSPIPFSVPADAHGRGTVRPAPETSSGRRFRHLVVFDGGRNG